MLVNKRGMWGRSLNSDLLQGFYLGNLLIEPLKGQITDRVGSRHLPPKAVDNLSLAPQDACNLIMRLDDSE